MTDPAQAPSKELTPFDGVKDAATRGVGLVFAPNDAAALWEAIKTFTHEPPADGFTDALAQALYGNDPSAVTCAMKHADDIEGDSTDARALRRLAEEVRRLRAAPAVTYAQACALLADYVVAVMDRTEHNADPESHAAYMKASRACTDAMGAFPSTLTKSGK